MMTEQAREARRAYRRKWAAEHPDKVKAAQERHWERVAAKLAARQEEQEEKPSAPEVNGE